MPVAPNVEVTLRNTLLRAAYEAGFSIDELSRFFDISRAGAHRILPRSVMRKRGNPHNKLTPAEVARRRNLRRIVQEISEILTDWSINRICCTLEVPRLLLGDGLARKPERIYPNTDVQVVALWNAGLGAKDICDLTGTSENNVSSSVLSAHGPLPPMVARIFHIASIVCESAIYL